MKREATADALGLHERASATPTRSHERSARYGSAPAAWTRGELSLRAQQEWFSAIVTAPEAERAPVDGASAARLVTPSTSLSALERLEIYRSAYHARLVECLADDYPVLEHALGGVAFEALCRAYIARFPSTSPSLNAFGRHMAEFCRESSFEHARFAADLAALEWAIVLAIHAPTSQTLTPADLARVPIERWPEARLEPNPALSVLELEYPANAYFHAVRNDERPSIPEPRASALAVYRTGISVWRMPLPPAMVALLAALGNDAPLGEALESIEPLLREAAANDPGELVMSWFTNAVSSGLFAGVRLDA